MFRQGPAWLPSCSVVVDAVRFCLQAREDFLDCMSVLIAAHRQRLEKTLGLLSNLISVWICCVVSQVFFRECNQLPTITEFYSKISPNPDAKPRETPVAPQPAWLPKPDLAGLYQLLCFQDETHETLAPRQAFVNMVAACEAVTWPGPWVLGLQHALLWAQVGWRLLWEVWVCLSCLRPWLHS